MVYKYRSTCRFPMLLQVSDSVLEIRPNQVIESEVELRYETLKEILPTPVIKKRRRTKKEKLDGTNNTSESINIRK